MTSSQPILVSKNPSVATRVASIDIFRGITLAVMVFVNALAEVKGLPWWTYHAHAQEDVMTYVDMVFPFFLFIVGMSLPLSVAQRLKRNPSFPRLWIHVILRSIALLVLGLILANADNVDAARTGMNGSLWGLVGLLSASLYLNIYPPSDRFPRYAIILRSLGMLGVIADLSFFRRIDHDGRVAWLDFSYPEILGLIGISYFAVCILYIPFRRWKWGPLAWFLLLVAFNALATARVLQFPSHISLYVWPFGNGAMPCIIMAGVVTSGIFIGNATRPDLHRVMMQAIVFACLMLIAGRILSPLGISKIRATPTWSLYSAGASVLVFALLYWVCGVRKLTGWAVLFRMAGANGLMTYLLPDFWDFLSVALGLTFLGSHWVSGWHAVLKTLLFTVCILLLAGGFTKARIRLQL